MTRPPADQLLTAAHVRQRYGGVSHMWIERRLQSDDTFPRPFYIGARRYWRFSELIAWEAGLPREMPRELKQRMTGPAPELRSGVKRGAR
jgi:predicted DNA-binding transcriptional regulator AlpA